MNALSKFTKRNLLLNKKRTTVTIVGILLSTALICAITGLISTYKKTLIDSAKRSTGDFYAVFNNVTEEESKYIINNKKVSSYYEVYRVGYANYENCARAAESFISIVAMDKEAIDKSSFELLEGKAPKNNSEIVLSERYVKNCEDKINIGDNVTFNVKKSNRIDDVDWENIDVTTYSEGEGEARTYTVTGILKNKINRSDDYNEYTGVIGFSGNKSDYAYESIFVKYEEDYVEDYYGVTSKIDTVINDKIQEKQEIMNSLGYDVYDVLDMYCTYSTNFNLSLVRYEGGVLSDSLNTMILGLGVILIVIIITTSVLVIRNAFNISISEKMKQYGVLSSVGATSKQIRNNVIYEGLITACIGIPLGILLGISAVYVLTIILNSVLDTVLNDVCFIFSVSPLAILIAVVLAFATIIISSLTAARRAKKVSPIVSIRNNNEVKIGKGKLCSPKYIKKVFHVGGDIAYKNLKRSRKKYRTTVLSIITSVIIFIATSTIMDYGFKLQGVYYEEYQFDTYVQISSEYTEEETNKIINDVKNLEGAELVSVHRETSAHVDKKYYSDFAYDYFDINLRSGYENSQYPKTEPDYSITVISIGDEAYRQYIDELGLNYDDCKDGGLLLDELSTKKDGVIYNGHIYEFKKGDTVPAIVSEEIDELGNVISSVTKDIEVVKTVTTRPIGIESTFTEGGYLVVSDEIMDSLDYRKARNVFIKTSEGSKVTETIEDRIENDPEYAQIGVSDLKQIKEANDSMILIIAIFLYGFITVITLIGVTNIFNTITTNMNLRSKEFAMLKSIGMTSKEFNRMISLESLFYGGKSLLIGLPIGLGFSYMIHIAYTNQIEISYIFPYKAVILAITFVFLIVGLIMRYSVSKITKQNIIETIRNDNI